MTLVLLVLWPVMTCHALLEEWNVIHEFHPDHDGSGGSHEHGSDNHDFADGGYVTGGSIGAPTHPAVFAMLSLPSGAAFLAWVSPAARDLSPSGLAPPRPPPPEISQYWQFWFRAALPVRAPSYSSERVF